MYKTILNYFIEISGENATTKRLLKTAEMRTLREFSKNHERGTSGIDRPTTRATNKQQTLNIIFNQEWCKKFAKH